MTDEREDEALRVAGEKLKMQNDREFSGMVETEKAWKTFADMNPGISEGQQEVLRDMFYAGAMYAATRPPALRQTLRREANRYMVRALLASVFDSNKQQPDVPITCDGCGTDYSKSDKMGGVHIGGKENMTLLCPDCAKTLPGEVLVSVKCAARPGETFREFVMQHRRGVGMLEGLEVLIG